MRSRWRRSASSMRSGSSPQAIPTRWTRRPRTKPEKIRAGCRRSVPRQRFDRRACRNARVGGSRALIFRFGLWPAALVLWEIAPTIPVPRPGPGEWKDGQLTLPGLAPLALPALAATRMPVVSLRRDGPRFFALGMVGARFLDWRRFNTPPTSMRWPAAGRGQIRTSKRISVAFPPTTTTGSAHTYTSMCGTLVRVEIERATGALRIAKAYSVLECGQALVPEVVLGQSQGGFAMGVGYALLETLPPYEGGPGNGQWNLGQVPGRARIRSAAARPRDRDAAAADTARAAEGHGGSGDDPCRSRF